MYVQIKIKTNTLVSQIKYVQSLICFGFYVNTWVTQTRKLCVKIKFKKEICRHSPSAAKKVDDWNEFLYCFLEIIAIYKKAEEKRISIDFDRKFKKTDPKYGNFQNPSELTPVNEKSQAEILLKTVQYFFLIKFYINKKYVSSNLIY